MATQKILPSAGRRNLIKAAAGAALSAASILPTRGAAMARASDAPSNTVSIKILAFDFQGSCVDYYDPINQMGQVINRNMGLSLDWGSMTKGWVENFYRAIAAHKDNFVPAVQLYRSALDTLLEQSGLSDKFSNAERNDMTGVWDRMIPWPDVEEGLTRLHRKFALTTLSNASMGSVFQTVHRHALPFDQVLTGELARAYKPDPQVYGLITSSLGYKTEEVLFCATHFADLKEAKKFGYRTAWWPRPLETGPGQAIDTAAKPFVDIYATDIIGLADKLGV